MKNSNCRSRLLLLLMAVVAIMSMGSAVMASEEGAPAGEEATGTHVESLSQIPAIWWAAPIIIRPGPAVMATDGSR